MIRRASAMIIPLALLTACGGGGKSGSLPPVNTLQTKKIGATSFSFRLPGKSTMSKLKRRYYQSQATLGVAIDWVSTTPTAPDYAAPISAVCPATLPAGVTACTLDAQGDTDYTFQLQIPAGTYTNFTVSTYDAAPSGGVFNGNVLAQGQLAAPVVIAAGTNNTIPNLTFYGVPASVSFQSGPAQSHVVTYGGNLSIIGSQPQTFFAQAVDADGYAISSNDNGAPAITVAESASDSPQIFAVATTSNPYAFTLSAINASSNARIVVTATPGGTGLSPVANNLAVTPVQELWTTLEAGSMPTGIFGYPLYSGTVGGPVDSYLDPIGNSLCSQSSSSCNLNYAAMDPTSGTIYAAGVNGSLLPEVFAFTVGSAPPGLIPPSGGVYTAASSTDTISSIAIDSQQHGFLVDNVGGTSTLEAYSTTSNAWAPVTSSNSAALTGAKVVAVAPTAPNVPTAMAGSLWVGLSSGGIVVYPPFSGTFTSSPATLTGYTGGDATQAIGFDSAGDLWTSDGTSVFIYSISGTPTSPSITELGSVALANSGTGGTSFGAAVGQAMYFGEGEGLLTGFDQYTATCASTCTIAVSAQRIRTSASSFAAFVTP